MSDFKTVLVTGGAGYIGSHTIVELLEKNSYNVVSIDSFINSSPKTFDRIKTITNKEVKNYELDLCDPTQLDNVFKENQNIVGVIHFAALKAVGESVEQPIRYFKNNINSLLNIIEVMEKYSIPNLIFSSSCTVYGSAKNLPVTEKTPLQEPESPYGLTKLLGEKIIKSYADSNKNFKASILRYFNPVGAHPSGQIGEDPRNKPNNLVPIITGVAKGIYPKLEVFGTDYPTRDGTCIRDYIHVSDIARAHLDALNCLIQENQEEDNCQVFNLGSGNGVTVHEVINAFESSTGQKLNYEDVERRPGDVAAIYADATLAKNKLGWEPQYTLEDMMQSAWKWQNNQS